MAPMMRFNVTPSKMKTRPETAINMTLDFPPSRYNYIGFQQKLVSLAKNLSLNPVQPENRVVLNLECSVVCQSAVQDGEEITLALKRAAHEEQWPRRDFETDIKALPEDDEKHPLKGGEVVICKQCTVRENKRLNRRNCERQDSRQVELFKSYDNDRLVAIAAPEHIPLSIGPDGSSSVNFDLRIACYNGHQGAKECGYSLIFSLFDSRNRGLVGQQMVGPFHIEDQKRVPKDPEASGSRKRTLGGESSTSQSKRPKRTSAQLQPRAAPLPEYQPKNQTVGDMMPINPVEYSQDQMEAFAAPSQQHLPPPPLPQNQLQNQTVGNMVPVPNGPVEYGQGQMPNIAFWEAMNPPTGLQQTASKALQYHYNDSHEVNSVVYPPFVDPNLGNDPAPFFNPTTDSDQAQLDDYINNHPEAFEFTETFPAISVSQQAFYNDPGVVNDPGSVYNVPFDSNVPLDNHQDFGNSYGLDPGNNPGFLNSVNFENGEPIGSMFPPALVQPWHNQPFEEVQPQPQRPGSKFVTSKEYLLEPRRAASSNGV